tara:strand:- start:448 stop:1191 length:744 start_codon:yes stop_codon:yes gene_type:complete
MDINKIYNSRNTLLKIYDKYGYDTSNIPNLSIKELKIILNEYKPEDQNIETFDVGFSFNFKLPSKIIEGHNLHIIYYNFNDMLKKHSKINKNIVDKILKLYESKYIGENDSIVLVINDKINDTVIKLNYTTKTKILIDYNIPETILNQMNSKNINMSKEYFRNITFLDIDTLQFNVLDHEMVPEHLPIHDKNEIKEILNQNNVTMNQLPIISKNDPISKLIRLVPGDICKIKRINVSGETIYYRLCK